MSEQTPTNLSNADFTFKDKYGNTGKTKGVSANDSTKLNNMVKLMNLMLNTPNSTDFINTLATKQYVDSESNKCKIDIDNIATDLNGKADTDLSNVPNSKGILVESYHNGSSWYRVYSDGWCEQGGNKATSTAHAILTVNFLKPFIDTNYNLTNTQICNTANAYESNTFVISKTTTSFTFHSQNNSSDWQACGYIS